MGADPLMGDGAGIMVQIPHDFFVREMAKQGVTLPAPGAYAVAAHLHAAGPRPAHQDGKGGREGHRGRGPDRARLARRAARQLVAAARRPRSSPPSPTTGRWSSAAARRVADDEAFERKLYIIRKVCSGKIYSAYEGKPNDFYVVSMSCRTLIYKGMFLAAQLRAYYTDLSDPDFTLGAGAGAPALFDQHLPELAAGAPLPLRLPQRRNQHRARQRQLDGGAPGVGQLRPVRRRYPEALADLLSGPVGHRLLRQRARIPDARRLLAAARGDDADPRSLGRQPADG